LIPSSALLKCGSDQNLKENGAMGWDVIIHSAAGLLSLVLGGLMVFEVFPWATDAFSIMMVIAFVSALIISWWTKSWVRGHFLAMAPIVGIGLGYVGVPYGFLAAYGLLCLAFGHFIYRGFVPPPSASSSEEAP
jgi:hypothetical protein